MATEHDWALVADGQRARIFQRRVPSGAWAELESEAVEQADPPAREWGSDRPGRARESVGGARHAIEPRSDPHEAAKLRFAEALVERLAIAAGEGRFGRLALVAPPAFLGHLREALPPALAQVILGTLDKDLTRHAPAEVIAHLAALHAP